MTAGGARASDHRTPTAPSRRQPDPTWPDAAAWGRAWLLLCLAFALHVVDEAANGFLAVYNPLARALRDRVPGLPVPVFTIEVWLAALAGTLAGLLALSVPARRGAGWMVGPAYGFAGVMLANGLAHIIGSLALGRALPGVWSSPVLLVASWHLIAATHRRRRAASHQCGGASDTEVP